MDLSSETNTYHSYIVNRVESNDTDFHVKVDSKLTKNYDAKPGPSNIPRPAKYIKKEPTARSNKNINRNVVFIHEEDEGSSNRTSKKPFKKRLLPSLQKFEFQTNIDSEASSSNFFSFGPKSTATDNDTKMLYTEKGIKKPQYAEKTTYCRPVLNLYNQEFIYKTMERNARLQILAKRLIDAREKEKQKEAWNNYINELRNKHKYAEVSHIPNYVGDENPDITDYYNTKFSWQQSNQCQNLLNDFYDTPNETNSNDYTKKPSRSTNYKPYIFENNSYCYPTSSQGRLLALNRERQNNRYKVWEYPQPNRYYRGNNIIMDKNVRLSSSKNRYPRTTLKKPFTVNKEVNTNIIRSLSVQTDFINIFDNKTDDRENKTLKEKCNLVSSNVMRLKEKMIQSKSSEKINTLAKIENKIDILIDSVNAFLNEIKSKKLMTTELRSRAVSCDSFDSYITSFQHKNDHVKFLKDDIFCGVVQEKSNSTGFHENTRDTIKDILFEEMNKSDQVKKDIEEILTKSDHSCSVHIEFEIPTKERSTEITDSFSKTVHSPQVNFQMFVPKEDKKMTIAVNTDPLGLLALIQVSGETLKRLLSFMPQIDYYSYLSMLQFSEANTISSYVCNICGAAFSKPSLLSNHIQNHNLGKSRDCCVCRHILDMKQHRSKLFKCRHCGQCFTRAYCKELHEHDCARRLGRLKDGTPSLVLLS